MPQFIHELKDFATGQVTQTIVPWTAETLRAEIADLRWQHETAGFSIEGQEVTTFRDERADWTERKLDAKERIEDGDVGFQYPYKPKGGVSFAVFTPIQVLRVCELFKWYVNACFVIEEVFFARIDSGEDLDTIHADAMNGANWPQRELYWIAPG
jgi:hypothetical protein